MCCGRRFNGRVMMALKLSERKEKYQEIVVLMLKSKHKEAFEKLTSMCGSDTGLFLLVDYDKAIASYQPNSTAQNEKG